MVYEDAAIVAEFLATDPQVEGVRFGQSKVQVGLMDAVEVGLRNTHELSLVKDAAPKAQLEEMSLRG